MLISIVPFQFAFLHSLFVNMTKENSQWHINEKAYDLVRTVCNNYSVFRFWYVINRFEWIESPPYIRTYASGQKSRTFSSRFDASRNCCSASWYLLSWHLGGSAVITTSNDITRSPDRRVEPHMATRYWSYLTLVCSVTGASKEITAVYTFVMRCDAVWVLDFTWLTA